MFQTLKLSSNITHLSPQAGWLVLHGPLFSKVYQRRFSHFAREREERTTTLLKRLRQETKEAMIDICQRYDGNVIMLCKR